MKEAEKAELNTITAKSTFTATPEQQELEAKRLQAAQEYCKSIKVDSRYPMRLDSVYFDENGVEITFEGVFLAGHAAGKQEAERWWAERYKALGYLTAYDGEREKQILAELDAKAKEMLG